MQIYRYPIRPSIPLCSANPHSQKVNSNPSLIVGCTPSLTHLAACVPEMLWAKDHTTPLKTNRNLPTEALLKIRICPMSAASVLVRAKGYVSPEKSLIHWIRHPFLQLCRYREAWGWTCVSSWTSTAVSAALTQPSWTATTVTKDIILPGLDRFPSMTRRKRGILAMTGMSTRYWEGRSITVVEWVRREADSTGVATSLSTRLSCTTQTQSLLMCSVVLILMMASNAWLLHSDFNEAAY